MKNFMIISLITVLTLTACKNKVSEKLSDEASKVSNEMEYSSYGDEISSENSLTAEEMEKGYQNLKVGDTVEVSFKTEVNEVCKAKGCWMKLDLPGDEDVMVKFEDYGFFVPKDIDQKDVIVNGKAYITEVSVEE